MFESRIRESAGLSRRLCIAPMMGCTDRHCRFLFRQLSPNAMLYSEMVTTGALIHGPGDQLLRHAQDDPCAIQLGGSDPAALAVAARMVEDAGYQEINLNCGCPSDRVQQGGIGACLMSQPALVADCYSAMAESVSIPVTIKSRIGIDENDDYDFFRRFIEHSHGAGARHFQVHARIAILSGLSPKENREVPPLNYDQVRSIAADFGDAKFVLNGGIKSVDQSVALLREFDGVMLGRAPYASPWLLAELEQAIFGTALPDRMLVFERYRDHMMQEIASGTHLKHMAKHLLGFFAGLPGARAFRRHLSENMFADDADVAVIDEAVRFVSLTPTIRETGT